MCLPHLKFSDKLTETHIFFIWPKQVLWQTVMARKKCHINRGRHCLHRKLIFTDRKHYFIEIMTGNLLKYKIDNSIHCINMYRGKPSE